MDSKNSNQQVAPDDLADKSMVQLPQTNQGQHLAGSFSTQSDRKFGDNSAGVPNRPECIDKDTTPILIYQMGKVGSMTVEKTLKSLRLPNPTHHIHFLSWKQIDEIERYYAGTTVRPRHLDRSRELRQTLDRNPAQRYKIITLVRDWVSRKISDLFQNMNTLLPEALSAGLSLSQSQEMIERYLSNYFETFSEEADFACTWFDKELKDVFAFDIFNAGFDKARGYQIYSTNRADILCLRLEDLSRVYQEAFSRFLGVCIPELIYENEGSEKQNHVLYQQVKSHFRAKGCALDKIYQSRLMTHFYTDEEINRFKSKWLKTERVENQLLERPSFILQTKPTSTNSPADMVLLPSQFQEFTYSRKSHFSRFAGYDQELFGCRLDPDWVTLKKYQDLLVFAFIKNHIPKGSRILDIGGGNSRILKYFHKEYECWNIDPLEGLGSGPKSLDPKGQYKLVKDYMGKFSKELPDNYFDFVFSISALEHVPGDNPQFLADVRDDINRVLKPGGYSLHCFDVIIKQDSFWTNQLLPLLFESQKTLNSWVSPDVMKQDPDLFVVTRQAYEKGPMAITRQSYDDFGKPSSYNILWQKAARPDSVEKNMPVINGDLFGQYPKITVVTPSYNQAAYLEMCIQSVLSQNYPNLEYIIMDGGSTDGSVDIIKKYQAYLSYWQSRPDGGQYRAVESGFKRSTGQIMTWLNSDDILRPGSLRYAAEIFASRSDVQWITGLPNTIDSHSQEYSQWKKAAPVWSRQSYLQRQFSKPFIQQEGTFWRRSLWEKAGAYLHPDYALAGDLELWVRFFRHTSLFTVEAQLGAFRHHDMQKSKVSINQYLAEAEKAISSEIELYNKAPVPLPSAPAPISREEYTRMKVGQLPQVPVTAAITSAYQEEKGSQSPRFSFVMIVLNGMPFIEYSLKSIYDAAHEIIIIEGAVEKCRFAARPDGSSRDGTMEFLRQFPDPCHKIRIVQGSWPEKCHMQNEALRYVTGDYVWLIDSDEVYKKEDLARVRDMIKQDPAITQISFIPYNFWKGLDFIFISDRLFEPKCYIRRIFKYRPGAVFTSHRPPTLAYPGNASTADQGKHLDGMAMWNQGITYYHYSYVLDSQVAQKMELYRRYDWGKSWKVDLEKWYSECYLRWTPQNRQEIESRWPVWTGDPRSRTVPYQGSHPEVMNAYLASIRSPKAAVNNPVSPKLKVAEEYVKAGMKIDEHSQFTDEVQKLFEQYRPRRIIETGTYLGRGTTTIIAHAMQKSGIDGEFYTIEINPNYYQQATAYFKAGGLKVNAVWGLSVPRSMLPAPEQIAESTITNPASAEVFVDHPQDKRVQRYWQETNYQDAPDNQLYHCLKRFDFRPDMVLLDSAGHMGFIEFQYLLQHLQGPCIIALDDIYHVKHHQSFQAIQRDPRFKILVASREKFGFCIARFEPQPVAAEKQPGHILWVRADAIGDAVLSSSMLPHIRQKYPQAKLTVVCQSHCAELYQHCPYIDAIEIVDIPKMSENETYLKETLNRILQLRADMVLHSVYSRHICMDMIVYASGAAFRIGLKGDGCNLSEEHRQQADGWYTRLIDSPGQWKSELQRHADFLAALGISNVRLEPQLWLSQEDYAFADAFFRSNQLDPAKTMAMFAGVRKFERVYRDYGKALAGIEWAQNSAVIALGSQSDTDLNQINLNDIARSGCKTLNLSGQLTLRQTAAIISRCRLAFGAETGLAHIAAIMGIPNVIVIGGGHLGRFMPYSAKTSLVCQPMDCFGCNWKCSRQDQRFCCVAGIRPEVIRSAIQKTVSEPSSKIRIFGQELPSQSICQNASARLSALLPATEFEYIPVKIQTAEAAAHPTTSAQYRVSAIVSTYNSEKFIRGCLQDLVEQTLYQKGLLEIVVINSGSQQNEDAIIREFQSRYRHIQYIKTPQRETIYAAWNRGIQAAQGLYMTNANTDDRHSPEMLEKLALSLDQNPNVAVVYSQYDVTHTPNQTWQTKTVASQGNGQPFHCRQKLLRRNYMGPFPMWRKQLHQEYGYFDAGMKVAGDYEFFLRVSQTHDFMLIPESLGLYYYNPDSLERSAGTLEQERQFIVNLYQRFRPYMIRRPLSAQRPQFTIIVCHDGSGNLADSVRSVLNQSTGDLELIVVDQSVHSDAQAIVQDNRVKYVRQDPKHHTTHAVVAGLAHCSSELFGVIKSGQMLSADAVAVMIKTHHEHPECGLIYFQAANDRFQTFKLRDYVKTSMHDADLDCAAGQDIVYKIEEVAGVYCVAETLCQSASIPALSNEDAGQSLRNTLFLGRARVNALKRRSICAAVQQKQPVQAVFERSLTDALNNDPVVQQFFRTIQNHKTLLTQQVSLPVELASQPEWMSVFWIAAEASIAGVVDCLQSGWKADCAGQKNAVVLATSLTTRDIDNQKQTVQSWLDCGFEVISVNNPDEIETLKPQFQNVRFVPVMRNGLVRYGKPLIYIDDILEALKASGADRVGIINSDIHLRMDGGVYDQICRECTGSLLYIRRMNVNFLGDAEGQMEKKGIDVFLMDRRTLAKMPSSQFCLGTSWWDCYFPLVCALAGIPLKRLDAPAAFHIKHTQNWDVAQWVQNAEHFFDCIYHLSLEGVFSSHSAEQENQWKNLWYFYQGMLRGLITEKNTKDTYIGSKCIHAIITQSSRPLDVPAAAPSADTTQAEALRAFEQAQDAFRIGNMISARRLMARYQSLIKYDLLSRTDRRKADTKPLLSVIIVTYQRSQDVAKLLDCLGRQTFRDFETILIDNGGTEMADVANKADCIIPCPLNFNPGEGRNIGVHFARGKIAVFIDDDALIGEDYLAAILQAFESYDILGLRGCTVPKTQGTGQDSVIYNLGDKPYPTTCNQEGNAAFLLSAWRAVGGHDPLLFGHEGLEFSWRLIQASGRRNAIMYWPKAVIYHDYGDAGKARRKRRQYQLINDYINYKFNASIGELTSPIETLALTPGNTLAALQTPQAIDGTRWYSLCSMGSREKTQAVPSPKVSVIIACYNTAEYLPQCLDGILAQTLTEWETILVDDGSTDGTPEILERYAKMDSRFRVYRFSTNEGPYVRRNFAIRQAKAPFISIQDADDVVSPVKFQVLLDEIVRDNSLGIVGSFYGQFMETFRGPEYCDVIRQSVTHQEIAKGGLYITWHASAIVRKTLFEQIGYYDCQPWGSDSFWLSKASVFAALTGRVQFKNVPEVLTYKRNHGKSQTGTILLNHPNGRRKMLSKYGKQKLQAITDQARQNPAMDVAHAIRECNCNDFIPQYGHLFEQWESSPITDELLQELAFKALRELATRLFVDCLISLNSLCSVSAGLEQKLKGVNLLRGLCLYVIGEDTQAETLLRKEYQDHRTPQAIRFLNQYFKSGDRRPNGQERRQIADNFIQDTRSSCTDEIEVLYDNRPSGTPEVSVILDCRAGELDFEAVLAEWANQSNRNFELLVITEGNHRDDFAGLNLPVAAAIINVAPESSSSAVKNKAVSFARGSILLFVSGRISIQSDCIDTVLDAMRIPATAAVSGRVKSAQKAWNPQWDYGNKQIYCSLDQDVLCAVRRQVFELVGGLDEGLWARDMLSLSWKIYTASDSSLGAIRYCPGLQGGVRTGAAESTEYLLHILAGEQLYWRLSAPSTYSAFITFTEKCHLGANDFNMDAASVLDRIARFFMGRYPEIAVQWAGYAHRLIPDSLAAILCLANCQWDAGNQNAAAEWFNKVLPSSFIAGIESRILSAQERRKYADILSGYASACLKLAQSLFAAGQQTQAQAVLNRLQSNQNVTLSADQQKLLDRLRSDKAVLSGQSSHANGAVQPAGSRYNPLVSVVIPAYNAARYIEQAIQSVLNQSYGKLELIIVNDGSVDNTSRIIRTYTDPRIRCYEQLNKGPSAAKNRGIKESRGELIVILDHDDLMTPEFVQKHVEAFEAQPEADLIYCDDHLIDENGNSRRVITRKEYNNPDRLISDLFRHGFPVVPFRTCVRRRVFEIIGFYDEALSVAEDYDMICRFAHQGLVAKHLPGAYYIRRVLADSQSRGHTPVKAKMHFGRIRNFIDTFDWNQLFPEVNWSTISPDKREFQGRLLSAKAFLAIGQTYAAANSPQFYAEIALDHAIEQLERCRELSPDNPESQELIQKCRKCKTQMAGVLV